MPAQRTEAGGGGNLRHRWAGRRAGEEGAAQNQSPCVSLPAPRLTQAGSAKTTEAPVSGIWEAMVPMALREDCCRR